MSSSNNPTNSPPANPYAQAATAYGDSAQKHTPDQRELEGMILLKSAKMIQDLYNNWDEANTDAIEATLKYNRQIWMIFYDTALENPEGDRPNDLRSNIINLANFIFKREVEILSDKEKDREKLNVLININKEVAAGLMTKPSPDNATQDETPEASDQNQDAATTTS